MGTYAPSETHFWQHGHLRVLYQDGELAADRTIRKFRIVAREGARDVERLAKGQFQIFYRLGSQQPEYVPDFVVETADCILMCETKARADMTDNEVQAKATAARKWCVYATDFSRSIGGKPWEYLLIPHDEVQENRSLDYFRAIAGGK